MFKNNLYAKFINSTSNNNNVLEMYNFLLKNLPKNVPLNGYWEIAFPNYSKTKNVNLHFKIVNYQVELCYIILFVNYNLFLICIHYLEIHV